MIILFSRRVQCKINFFIKEKVVSLYCEYYTMYGFNIWTGVSPVGKGLLHSNSFFMEIFLIHVVCPFVYISLAQEYQMRYLPNIHPRRTSLSDMQQGQQSASL